MAHCYACVEADLVMLDTLAADFQLPMDPWCLRESDFAAVFIRFLAVVSELHVFLL